MAKYVLVIGGVDGNNLPFGGVVDMGFLANTPGCFGLMNAIQSAMYTPDKTFSGYFNIRKDVYQQMPFSGEIHDTVYLKSRSKV